MAWYHLLATDGTPTGRRLFAGNPDDLAANVPAGFMATPDTPVNIPTQDDPPLMPIEVPTLDAVRLARWTTCKARRDQAEWGGCSTPLGRVDSDPDSQRKASGSVQMAMIAQAAGAPFAIDWTMQDNSTATHDAPAMIGMGVAVGQHVAACHEAALVKRAAINAATTAEDIDAVDIEGGWPGA